MNSVESIVVRLNEGRKDYLDESEARVLVKHIDSLEATIASLIRQFTERSLVCHVPIPEKSVSQSKIGA